MSTVKQIKAVLFDKDGTIMDSERINCEAYVAAAKSLNVEFTPAMFQAFIGVPTLECYASLQLRYGPSFPLDEFIKKVKTSVEKQKKVGMPLKQGFAQYFDYLVAKSIPLAVVTSAGHKSAMASLEPLNLLNSIEVVVTVDDVIHPKPSPECYQLACQKLKIEASEALVFEDSNIGIKAALDAGCNTIAIPDTQALDPELTQECLAVIASFEDAYRFV